MMKPRDAGNIPYCQYIHKYWFEDHDAKEEGAIGITKTWSSSVSGI